MSLFRKPKKIQRRMFCADDEDDGDPEPPPPPVISHEREKKENKPIKTTSLLSFADEEEEAEVFKVKKSSQSKRLAKRREKEKRRGPDGDSNKYDNNVQEEEKIEPENNKTEKKKKVTLEGLILSGREALAADGAGDVSDSPEEEEEDERGFHRYRAESVRAALAEPGRIPDAALIHAARKTRQQARELGDFVPIQNEKTQGSRLVRDDGSGDDEDEDGRIHVRGLDLPSDKPKRGTAAAPTNEELDSEVEEWEEQQMQKAMPALADITGEAAVELNPFSLPPPPPPPAGAPHLRPLTAAAPLHTAGQLLAALNQRVEELCIRRVEAREQSAQLRARLERAAHARETRGARTPRLDAKYRRAQAVRGFITDLIECLDEKMPQLEALEARALALHRRRCSFLVERRRADVRDQADDTRALTARPGSVKPVDSEEKRRRCAEREGRRRARRRAREAAGSGAAALHREGDSSDDELPPAEREHHRAEAEAIRSLSAALFADTLPAWRSVRGVCARLARWRRAAPALYGDAHAARCLPRLLAPYVRHQLILWNPLADEDNEDYEKMDWYKCVMMYGVRRERLSSESSSSSLEADEEEEGWGGEDQVRDDPDLRLVPTLVNKVVLPKLTELVEHAWDPMCVRASVRLRQLLIRAAGTPGAARALPPLAAAVLAALRHAHRRDVFLPPLPPQVAEGPAGVFWRRCLGASVRLLRAALALASPPPLLHADKHVLALLETLSCAAGAAPGPQVAQAAAALADSLPRAGALRAAALRRLAALAALALARLQPDNPLHLKALEQARNVASEARAAED